MGSPVRSRLARAVGCTIVLTAVILAAAGPAFPLDLLHPASAWQQRLDWLGNADPQAALTAMTGVRLTVPAGHGMKWSRSLRDAWLLENPWLVVRYRADGVRPSSEYFVWLQADGEVEPIRLDQVQADGQWHTVAVDLSRLTGGDEATMVALHVQAAETPATVELVRLELLETPPAGAELLGEVAPPAPDWRLAGHAAGSWQPQPAWLGNAAAHVAVSGEAATATFRVGDPGRGMKWSLSFAAPVDPRPYRFLSLRVRGTGVSGGGEYAVAVLGDSADGRDYEILAPAAAFDTAGRWQQLDLPLGKAGRWQRIAGLAVQAWAGHGPARLEIAEVRLTSSPTPRRLADMVSVRTGRQAGAWQAIPLGGEPAHGVAFHIEGWPAAGWQTVEGVPFRLTGRLRAMPPGDEGVLTLPLAGRASELYLLMLARLVGPEQRLLGGGRLSRLADYDRFHAAVVYADGTVRRAVPRLLPTGAPGLVDGAQVLVVPADPRRELQSLRLYVGTRQARVAVAAVTRNAGRARHDGHRQAGEPPRSVAAKPLPAPRKPTARLVGKAVPSAPPGRRRGAESPPYRGQADRLTLANRYLSAEFDLAQQVALLRLDHRRLRTGLTARPQPLFTVKVSDTELPPAAWRLQYAGLYRGIAACRAIYRCAQPALQVTVELLVDDQPRLTARVGVRNLSRQPLEIGLRAPRWSVGCGSPTWHLAPASATLLGPGPLEYQGWYSGAALPLPFVDVFSPAAGGGLGLLARDKEGLEKQFSVRHGWGEIDLSLAGQPRLLYLGQGWQTPPVDLLVHTGDWRAAYAAYRQWAATWYRPVAPRPAWWREVFNFRQRFLYWLDPLADRQTGRYAIDEALAEAKREFGGIEYLHIFDWGSVPWRSYGRGDDPDPGGYLPGGWAGFRQALSSVQRQGLHAGCYIEGYLLDERGPLGQAHGAEWQMVGRDGSRSRWPQSSEIYACPGVPAWRAVQAGTYARTVACTGADGMYLDQLGFAGPGKWCWSPDHAHPVPSSSLATERSLLELVRAAVDRVKPGVVLYTEDSPTDVNSQYQEGSFCYSMNRHQAAGSTLPLKLFRFAHPSFKTFEILDCDHPTGTWAQGVRWTFWNGEGIWLEGPAAEWFAPQTRRAIRACHAVLRAHRRAFAGDDAEPLVPTLAAGVSANRFTGGGETVYTLYNSRLETFAGPVLALPHRAGARYMDAFSGRRLTPRRQGRQDVIWLEVDPTGVGAVVVSRP